VEKVLFIICSELPQFHYNYRKLRLKSVSFSMLWPIIQCLKIYWSINWIWELLWNVHLCHLDYKSWKIVYEIQLYFLKSGNSWKAEKSLCIICAHIDYFVALKSRREVIKIGNWSTKSLQVKTINGDKCGSLTSIMLCESKK
jgi:hypothetical protein